jgi:hypothetical protein
MRSPDGPKSLRAGPWLEQDLHVLDESELTAPPPSYVPSLRTLGEKGNLGRPEQSQPMAFVRTMVQQQSVPKRVTSGCGRRAKRPTSWNGSQGRYEIQPLARPHFTIATPVLITFFDGGSFIAFPMPVALRSWNEYWEVFEPLEYNFFGLKTQGREGGKGKRSMELKST